MNDTNADAWAAAMTNAADQSRPIPEIVMEAEGMPIETATCLVEVHTKDFLEQLWFHQLRTVDDLESAIAACLDGLPDFCARILPTSPHRWEHVEKIILRRWLELLRQRLGAS